jgi:hypothetical protein
MSESKNAVTKPKSKTPLHPLSGGVILGLDWLLFSGNVLSGLAATPLVIFGGLLLGFVGTFSVQRFISKDSIVPSLIKAIGAGIVVGIPWPIAGTAVGGAILGWSGLSLFKNKALSAPKNNAK